jgi:hypothetical protein
MDAFLLNSSLHSAVLAEISLLTFILHLLLMIIGYLYHEVCTGKHTKDMQQ